MRSRFPVIHNSLWSSMKSNSSFIDISWCDVFGNCNVTVTIPQLNWINPLVRTLEFWHNSYCFLGYFIMSCYRICQLHRSSICNNGNAVLDRFYFKLNSNNPGIYLKASISNTSNGPSVIPCKRSECLKNFHQTSRCYYIILNLNIVVISTFVYCVNFCVWRYSQVSTFQTFFNLATQGTTFVNPTGFDIFGGIYCYSTYLCSVIYNFNVDCTKGIYSISNSNISALTISMEIQSTSRNWFLICFTYNFIFRLLKLWSK
jgi:hypothetical protein